MPTDDTMVIGALYNSDDDEASEFQQKPLDIKVAFRPSVGALNDLNREGGLSDSLLNEKDMQESMIVVHGTNKEHPVKITDKSKRAFDTSLESTRALELAIQKDNRQCSNCYVRLKSVVYSTWILLFKANVKAPMTNVNFWFLCYSMTFALEVLLTAVFMIHLANPVSNVWSFGAPFLFILPGVTVIAPVWGLLAVIFGSAQMMKSYSSMNSTMLVINYPLTLLYLLVAGEQLVYSTLIFFLILNKVTLSFFGAKVR